MEPSHSSRGRRDCCSDPFFRFVDTPLRRGTRPKNTSTRMSSDAYKTKFATSRTLGYSTAVRGRSPRPEDPCTQRGWTPGFLLSAHTGSLPTLTLATGSFSCCLAYPDCLHAHRNPHRCIFFFIGRRGAVPLRCHCLPLKKAIPGHIHRYAQDTNERERAPTKSRRRKHMDKQQYSRSTGRYGVGGVLYTTGTCLPCAPRCERQLLPLQLLTSGSPLPNPRK